MNNNLITIFILAGGKSSRMGTDKGLIPFRGKTIIEQIIDKLKPLTENIVIISNNPDYKTFGYEVIPDIIKDIGPAGGIHTALTHYTTDLNFIVSCDMPFITTEAAQLIINLPSDAQIIVPEHEGKIEPLFGLYHKSCLPQWDALIRQGFLKLQEMIACFNLLKTDVSGHPLFNYPLFVNINTPDDLSTALTNTDL